MAILNSHKGSWFGLPDFGITEKLTSNRTSQGGSNIVGSTSQSQPVYNGPLQSPGVDKSTYTPTPSGGGNGSGSNGGQVLGQTYSPQITSPDQNNGSGQSEMDLINSEFDSFHSYLSGQEGVANQRFNDTSSAITSERDTALTDTNAQRGIRDTELTNKAESGRQNERLNLQKVRQLLQDLEQKNAARTAIVGGGGSINEALADRFGRTAQTNVGGVLQEGQRFQNDIGLEKEKVAQFYDNAVAKIKDTATAQINNARGLLNENLSKIDAERRASAGEKARARYDAWKTYYANVNQAKLQAASFQAQYDLWSKTKTAELAGATSYQPDEVSGADYGPYLNQSNYSNGGIGGGVGTVNQQAFAPTQFNRIKGGRPEDEENQLVA